MPISKLNLLFVPKLPSHHLQAPAHSRRHPPRENHEYQSEGAKHRRPLSPCTSAGPLVLPLLLTSSLFPRFPPNSANPLNFKNLWTSKFSTADTKQPRKPGRKHPPPLKADAGVAEQRLCLQTPAMPCRFLGLSVFPSVDVLMSLLPPGLHSHRVPFRRLPALRCARQARWASGGRGTPPRSQERKQNKSLLPLCTRDEIPPAAKVT